MATKPVYVASDAHLTPTSHQRTAPFLAWLDWVGERASGLVLNGDLFDFWYEYGSVVPRGYTRLLGRLRGLVDEGVEVSFMGGNHDWWVGSYFTEELGITVYRDPVRIDLAGHRTLLAHGDGLGSGDLGYRFLKAVLRGSFTRWAFRWLHPDWGAAIARRVSKTEFRDAAPSPEQTGRADFLGAWARERLAEEEELDLVLLGHTHIPVLEEILPGRWYANTGDWIHHRSFLELAPGEPPRLRTWNDGAPVSLPARTRGG